MAEENRLKVTVLDRGTIEIVGDAEFVKQAAAPMVRGMEIAIKAMKENGFIYERKETRSGNLTVIDFVRVNPLTR